MRRNEARSRKAPKACLFVVDDQKAVIDSIEAQFTYCGFEVIKATDPDRALTLSHEIKPDLIIADIRMPKLDGIGLLKQIKKLQPNIKVILMTGFYPDYEEEVKVVQASGLVDSVIQKPFYATDLEKLVYGLLKTPEDEIEFSLNAKGKILIVDDEGEITDFLKEYFRDAGFSAAIASNAEEALLVYDDFDPDVVITDIKMPGRDGVWLVNELRSGKKRAKIFVMTGQDSHEVLERLRSETGIERYFRKPFGLDDLERLRTTIDGLLKKNK